MIRRNNTHLRIVWNKDARQFKEPTQLNFSFPTQKGSLITFIVESAMSGALLSRALRTIRPHYLLDLRACPRFDIYGYTRQKAFFEFERYGAKYYCLSTEEASTSIPERIHKLIEKLGNKSKIIDGPLLVFIENEEIVDQVSHALPKPKSKKGKWSIAVERAEI